MRAAGFVASRPPADSPPCARCDGHEASARRYRRNERRAQVHRIGRGRRVVPSAVAVAVAVAVGLCGPQAASARPGLARAAAWPPMTMRLFDRSGKRVPTRVRIRRQHVTCAEGRRLIATYLRRVSPRTWASHGTHCILPGGGGWVCSFVAVGGSEATGGVI